jgi:glyoxylase-like metal-dependent hydrolase (beta-lactamase superfamily II)
MRLQLGAATVSVINCGALYERLADWLGLKEGDWPAQYDHLFAQPLAIPVQCVHIALPNRSLLLDPCHPELLAAIGDLPPDAAPVSGLLDQLAALGIDAGQIDTVVITHTHFDHYCGILEVGEQPEQDQLLFPQARHLVGKGDYDLLQEAFKNPASPQSRSLGLVERHGLLEPIVGEVDLGDGLRIIPLPGETVGHQGLRLATTEGILYCIGDLYHHEVEIKEGWGVHWANGTVCEQSRQRLINAALAEEALLIAAHIGGIGRLVRNGAGLRWEAFNTPAPA